jgi:hypothetical protein
MARVRRGRVGKTADIKAEISSVLYTYDATGLRGSDRFNINMDFSRTVRLLAVYYVLLNYLQVFQNLRTHLEVMLNVRNGGHGKNRREVILENIILKMYLFFLCDS